MNQCVWLHYPPHITLKLITPGRRASLDYTLTTYSSLVPFESHIYQKKQNKVDLLCRLICAEDAGAVHLSDSISHKRRLSLEARGSSGALPLQVREDGHHVSSLHVWEQRKRRVTSPRWKTDNMYFNRSVFESHTWGWRGSPGQRREHLSARRCHTERRPPPPSWAASRVWEHNRKIRHFKISLIGHPRTGSVRVDMLFLCCCFFVVFLCVEIFIVLSVYF